MASVAGMQSGGAPTARSAPRGRRGRAADPVGQLIELEVIPRLLVAHSDPPPAAIPGRTTITEVDVERFTPLVLHREAHQVLDVVESYLRRGISVETLFVELLAPVARRLGRGWEEDSLDFVEVTMGLWRIQEVLREIAARTPRIGSAAITARTALFAAMPGEQHTLGTAMVEECFGRAGWDTELLIEANRAELLDRVASRSLDLVGLTVSCDSHIERLPSLIVAVRSLSRNPNLIVMIGGRVPTLNPALTAFVGADATAATATAAVAVAERLVSLPRCAVSA